MKSVYKNFRIGDVLNFDSTKGIFHAINVNIEESKSKTNHPYIVRTSKNNGVRGYINEDINKLNPGNTISFAQDTAQMFYQEEPYFTGNKIKVLSIKNHNMNKYIALFIISCLNKSFSNFGWGSSYNTKTLAELPLSLPTKIDKDENPLIDNTYKYHSEGYIPDFDYMEKKIKEIEQEIIKETEEKHKKELELYLKASELNNYELNDEDKKFFNFNYNKDKFKIFKIDDVLNFDSTKGIFHAINVNIEESKSETNHPYVVRTSKNNGIRGYINEDINKLNPSNTISFAQDTAQMFYQEEPYFTGNKIKVLSIKNHSMNKYIALFIISCLNKSFSNFGWGSSYNTKTLIELPLSLPIKTNGNNTPIIDKEHKYHPEGYIPDWEFMENYIKVIQKVVIADKVKYNTDYLDSLKSIINE